MPSYFELEYGRGFLKNFTNDEMNPVAEEGNQRTFDEDDLREAEDFAYREINASLVGFYDISPWSNAAPPVIAQVAELIGAGYMWLKRINADIGDGEVSANGLLNQGRDLLKQVRSGTMLVIATNGSVQARRVLQDTYELG